MNKKAIFPVLLVTFFVILSVFGVYAFTENPSSRTVGESNRVNLTAGESLTSEN